MRPARPVARSQITTVSRWFVMPIATAARRLRDRLARRVAHALEDLASRRARPSPARERTAESRDIRGRHAPVFADHEAGDAGRAFVDREHVLHESPSLKSYWRVMDAAIVVVAVMRSAGVTSNAGL